MCDTVTVLIVSQINLLSCMHADGFIRVVDGSEQTISVIYHMAVTDRVNLDRSHTFTPLTHFIRVAICYALAYVCYRPESICIIPHELMEEKYSEDCYVECRCNVTIRLSSMMNTLRTQKM